MNKWISVNDMLPDPFEVVWIFWRDREVLFGCRTYEDDEEHTMPPNEGWYSFEDVKCRWTNWWMPVRHSLDKPEPPQMENK